MKNRKIIVTAFLLIACMVIGVGYAAVTDYFTINGQATISDQGATDAFNEDVRFAGVVVDGTPQSDVLAGANLGYTASCNVPLDQASFHINSFKGQGDTHTVIFRVQNYGDIDSTLKLDPGFTATNGNDQVFSVTYNYKANGTGAEATAFPTEGVTIAQNEFVDIYVTVSVINSVNAETTADFVFKFIAENTTTP